MHEIAIEDGMDDSDGSDTIFEKCKDEERIGNLITILTELAAGIYTAKTSYADSVTFCYKDF